MSDSPGSNGNSTHSKKIPRLIEKYNLDGIGAELEQRWTKSEGNFSIRDLADYFNKQILRKAMSSQGIDPLQHEVDTLYSTITDENRSSGEIVIIRERLERDGIDFDSLIDEFISHQTVYNYLTEDRDAVYKTDTTPEQRVSKSIDHLQSLQNRTSATARTSINSLSDTDIVSIGEYDITTEIAVYCHDCGSRYSFTELLEGRRCECN